MKPEMISLKQTYELCRLLARDVEQSQWTPDCVLGIASKGSVVAYYVASILEVPFAIVSTIPGCRPRQLGEIVTLDDVNGKRVLVVDDAIKTGNLADQLSRWVRQSCGVPRTATPVLIGPSATADYSINALRLPEVPIFSWSHESMAQIVE